MAGMINAEMGQPLLARDVVRFVGEPVAVVVTEERYQGEDAVELVDADYDQLPPVIGLDEAAAGGDPRVRDGRTDEVDVARAGQAHVLGIDAAGGQEAGIFGPDDPGAQYAHAYDLACPGRRWSKRADAPPGTEDRVTLLR